MRLVLNIVLLSVLALVPLFVSIPSYSPFYESLNDSAHALLFLTLGLVTFKAFKLPQPARKSVSIWLIFVAVLLGLGVGIEVVQSFIGRSATLSDVLLDGLGILAAVSVYWARFVCGTARLLLLALAFTALLAAFSSPLQVLWHKVQLNNQLPVICDFDSPCPVLNSVDGSKVLVQKTTSTHVQKKGAPADEMPILWRNNESLILRITYPATAYPGAGFDRVMSNWQGFSALCAQVYWPYLSAGQLGIHIHDKRFKANREKFDHIYPLNAGVNDVCVSLAQVAQAVDLAGVKTLVYYIPKPHTQGEFYIDNIRLR